MRNQLSTDVCVNVSAHQLTTSVAFSIAILFYLGLLASGIAKTLSVVFFAMAFAISITFFFSKMRVQSIFLLVLLFSCLKVGYYLTVNSNIPISMEFINSEGRFLVVLAILLSLASMHTSINAVKLFIKYGLLLYIAWLPIFFTNVLTGRQIIDASHHQIGLTVLSGLILVMLPLKLSFVKKIFRLLLVAIILLALMYSGSRTSLLAGLILLFGPIFWQMRLYKKLIVFIMVAVSFLYLGSSKVDLGNRSYELAAFVNVYDGILYGINHANEISRAYDAKQADLEEGDFNITARAVVFGKALQFFSSSPIIGIGEGRFDDDFDCTVDFTLVCLSMGGESNFKGSSAHNTYLHILAEEGLIGFLVSMFLLWRIRGLLLDRKTLLDTFGIRHSTIIFSWWVLMLTGLFNHVLASPLYALSLFVPIFLIATLRSSTPELIVK